MITVFTPTYNRAKLLPRLFESLKKQSYKDFEWLIVDDGSSDGTKLLVDKWTEDNPFTIRYLYQENGGKHRAINRGAQIAKGELFYIVDSDDILPNESLETIWFYYEQIKDDESFAGVCGLKAYYNGDLLPGRIDYDVLDCRGVDYDYRRDSKKNSDIAEYVVKTSIIRHFKFPEYENENFCAESAIWNPIGNKYKYRYFNKIIYYCEFLKDGLSANSLRNRMKCPLSSMHIYRDLCTFDIPYLYKVKSAINYWRFFFCSFSAKRRPSIPILYILYLPAGYLIHLRDKTVTNRKNRLGVNLRKDTLL